MPYIYATALPGDIVKLGRGTHKNRALAAQVYFVQRINAIAVWRVPAAVKIRGSWHGGDRALERAALKACAHWHVRGELFQVPVDWLMLEHPVVTCLRPLLGEPLPDSETPRWRRKGGVAGSTYKKTHSSSGRPPWPESRAARGLEPQFRRKPAHVPTGEPHGRPVKNGGPND